MNLVTDLIVPLNSSKVDIEELVKGLVKLGFLLHNTQLVSGSIAVLEEE